MHNKEQYKLDNGWIVWTDGSEYFLDTKPLENTIFTKEQTVKITEQIFKAVKNGECKILTLFKEYNLLNFLIKWTKPTDITLTRRESVNTENTFYGREFIVSKERAKYFLEYQLDTQGGGSRKFEISQEVYEDARKGNKTASDLFKKFNLYHLDTPANDV
ncbi:MAG: hypothetical protein R2798_12035 [Chitinophagales bacterium]|nr:hypothetical protein [Bacteroidota bacterium]MCB9043632.1 hypothetical protein [Chitinophagales bacterium]